MRCRRLASCLLAATLGWGAVRTPILKRTHPRRCNLRSDHPNRQLWPDPGAIPRYVHLAAANRLGLSDWLLAILDRK